MHDFDIYVGNSAANGSFVSNGYALCKHHAGTVSSGEVVVDNCTSIITGRYIVIQIIGNDKTLTLCEVQAFNARGDNIFSYFI